ncbi:MAG TPA: metallophosphoesterase [Syntrophales bacterium]|nr:metallophosphoesterase [Syntrophales bacterium]
MILFLLTFFLVYGGAHLYLFAKIRGTFHLSIVANISLIIFMVIMILAPIVVRISERYGYETFARFMSYTGYIWMGVLFLFFVSSLFFDLYRLLTYTGSHITRRDLSHLAVTPVYAFMIPLLISLGINTYGYFEAKNIRIEKMTIQSPKIPEAVGRIRIVQMSDVHIGLIVRDERLQRIIEEIKKAEPDILVATGDLLDGQINRLEEPLALLRDISPRYGKFAITGNHEFFAGIDQAVAFMKDAGFVVLRGEGLNVAGMINIAGVDDPTGISFGLARPVSEKVLLSGLSGQYFTILLKHQPDVDNDAAGYFNLQLSGHTHGGQIFPFNFVTKLFFPFNRGYFNLPYHSHLYVSRGAGTWGPPIRFLSPPEIAVIDLIHDKG